MRDEGAVVAPAGAVIAGAEDEDSQMHLTACGCHGALTSCCDDTMCTDRMVRRKGRAREGFGRSIVDELSSWLTRGWWIPVAPLSLNHHVSRRGAGATLTRFCRFAGFALEPDGGAAVLDRPV